MEEKTDKTLGIVYVKFDEFLKYLFDNFNQIHIKNLAKN